MRCGEMGRKEGRKEGKKERREERPFFLFSSSLMLRGGGGVIDKEF